MSQQQPSSSSSSSSSSWRPSAAVPTTLTKRVSSSSSSSSSSSPKLSLIPALLVMAPNAATATAVGNNGGGAGSAGSHHHHHHHLLQQRQYDHVMGGNSNAAVVEGGMPSSSSLTGSNSMLGAAYHHHRGMVAAKAIPSSSTSSSSLYKHHLHHHHTDHHLEKQQHITRRLAEVEEEQRYHHHHRLLSGTSSSTRSSILAAMVAATNPSGGASAAMSSLPSPWATHHHAKDAAAAATTTAVVSGCDDMLLRRLLASSSSGIGAAGAAASHFLSAGVVGPPLQLPSSSSVLSSAASAAVTAATTSGGQRGLVPSRQDVIVGTRTTKWERRRHPGNVFFQKLIENHMDAYHHASEHKKVIVRSIIQAIYRHHGRFVEKMGGSDDDEEDDKDDCVGVDEEASGGGSDCGDWVVITNERRLCNIIVNRFNEQYRLEQSVGLSDFSVLIARGMKCNDHPGNRALSRLIEENFAAYESASHKKEILQRVIRAIKDEPRNGCFLEKIGKRWIPIDDVGRLENIIQSRFNRLQTTTRQQQQQQLDPCNNDKPSHASGGVTGALADAASSPPGGGSVESMFENSVLMSVGKTFNDHPGNILLKNLVQEHISAFKTAPSRRDVVRNVMNAITTRGGRFLEKVADRWTPIDQLSRIERNIESRFYYALQHPTTSATVSSASTTNVRASSPSSPVKCSDKVGAAIHHSTTDAVVRDNTDEKLHSLHDTGSRTKKRSFAATAPMDGVIFPVPASISVPIRHQETSHQTLSSTDTGKDASGQEGRRATDGVSPVGVISSCVGVGGSTAFFEYDSSRPAVKKQRVEQQLEEGNDGSKQETLVYTGIKPSAATTPLPQPVKNGNGEGSSPQRTSPRRLPGGGQSDLEIEVASFLEVMARRSR